MKQKKTLALAAMILTVIMWGISFLSIKISVEVLPPMTLAVVRFVMASFLLAVVFKKMEPETRLAKKDMPAMALAGVLGVSLYFYFENTGIKLISASAASIIVATIPVITLIGEAIFLKASLTKRKLASVCLSMIGVYYVIGGNIRELFASGDGLGYLMMMGAVLVWVAYTIITKPLFGKYSDLAIVFYQTIFGTLAMIPFMLLEKTSWHLVDKVVILNVVYLGVFCSAIAYYLYVYAMNVLGVSVTSLYLNVVPMVTVIASFFILKEQIMSYQILGGALVVAAVYLANWEGSKRKASSDNIAILEE